MMDGIDEGDEIDAVVVLAKFSPLIEELLQDRRKQSLSVFLMYTDLAPLVHGLDEARAFFASMADVTTVPALSTLATRTHHDIGRAFACLSTTNDGSGLNDISRDLMEIEMLMRDFHRDVASLERWATLAARERSDAYKHNKVVDRVGRAAGVTDGNVLPDAAEYQAHSAGLHPTPHGRPFDGLGLDLRTSVATLSADLIRHVTRSVRAFITLAVDHPEVMPEAFDFAAEWPMPSLVGAESMANSINADMVATMVEFGMQVQQRGPYSRREFPDGVYRFKTPDSDSHPRPTDA